MLLSINGSSHYTGIRGCLPNINGGMLPPQLRKLKERGVVKRHVYTEVPGRVMYELTELDYQLRPIIEERGKWGEDNVPSPAIGQRDAGHVLQHETTVLSMWWGCAFFPKNVARSMYSNRLKLAFVRLF